MVIEEFIQTYGDLEKEKIDEIKRNGGDPFAVDD